MVNLQNGGGWAFYTDTTTAVTISVNMVSFEDNFSGGGEYSYRVEGLLFFNGRVESNLLTVTVPSPGG